MSKTSAVMTGLVAITGIVGAVVLVITGHGDMSTIAIFTTVILQCASLTHTSTIKTNVNGNLAKLIEKVTPCPPPPPSDSVVPTPSPTSSAPTLGDNSPSTGSRDPSPPQPSSGA